MGTAGCHGPKALPAHGKGWHHWPGWRTTVVLELLDDKLELLAVVVEVDGMELLGVNMAAANKNRPSLRLAK